MIWRRILEVGEGQTCFKDIWSPGKTQCMCLSRRVNQKKRNSTEDASQMEVWLIRLPSLTSHFHTLSNCIKFFWMMRLKFELKRCCRLILDGWCSAWEILWFRYSSDCTSQLFTIKSQSSWLICSHKPRPECSHCMCEKKKARWLLLSGLAIHKSQWRLQGRFVY